MLAETTRRPTLGPPPVALPVRHVLTFAILAVGLLTGCREAVLVDAPPATDTPPDAPPGATGRPQLYIKGGGSSPVLALGRPSLLRVQSHPDATRYSWNFSGEGVVEIDYRDHPREVLATGQIEGDVRVEVFAYNGVGGLVASGARTFNVVR